MSGPSSTPLDAPAPRAEPVAPNQEQVDTLKQFADSILACGRTHDAYNVALAARAVLTWAEYMLGLDA